MKTAFITGGGNGLGAGFVSYLLNRDFLVFSGNHKIDLNINKHNNLRIIPLDVSDDVSIKNAYNMVSKEIDHIDLLINNAGVNKDTATNNNKELVCNLKSLDRDALLKMFNINAISPMMMLKYFLPLLESSDLSFVVNVSSDRASYHDELENNSGNYGYRASKIALNMMTYCSLKDLPQNVKIFAVHPGSVKTHMNPSGMDLPYNQAEKIIKITENWKESLNGKFLRFDGNIYPL